MTDPTPSQPPADVTEPDASANGPALSAADDQEVDIAGTEADEQSAAGRALRDGAPAEDDPTAGPLGSEDE
jgi:hypothetical protein